MELKIHISQHDIMFQSFGLAINYSPSMVSFHSIENLRPLKAIMLRYKY